jgi:hypothetical protein
MNRLDSMLERLPPIYRISSGSLLNACLSVQSNHQTAFDEDMQRVQRAHWIDTALDREDLGKIGALCEIPMMPWEPTELYRTRLKATAAARLRGAVTRDVLEFVLIQILSGAIEALRVRYLDLSAALRFRSGVTNEPGEPAFIEFPPVLRRSKSLIERRGLLRSLDRFELTNQGLHPAPMHAIVRGVAGRLCMTPVLVNLTNGMVLAYAGDLACGHELRIETTARGELRALLNGEDVRARVYTGTGFVPGAQFSPVVPDPTPQPLLLERGANAMWFFPLALYDLPSLGSAVLGMPKADLEHGRFGGKGESKFGGTHFDNSLFEQTPAASLDVWWIESRPAAFRFEIPAGVVVRDASAMGDAHVDRLRLFALLQQTVDLMRAAGVQGRVDARPLRESQQQRDRATVLPPVIGRDEMRTEARLSALSALFDMSDIDRSRFA